MLIMSGTQVEPVSETSGPRWVECSFVQLGPGDTPIQKSQIDVNTVLRFKILQQTLEDFRGLCIVEHDRKFKLFHSGLIYSAG
jgi:hypothetical protein